MGLWTLSDIDRRVGGSSLEEISTELRNFLEEHFQRTTDATVFIHYIDFVDFIFERTDLPMDKVKRILALWQQKDLEIHNGRVYGLQCITDVEINMAEDEVASSATSSDDDASDSEEEDL
jgi:hypothetical protein